MHVTSDKALKAEYYGPIIIDYRLTKNDSNKYDVKNERYIRFSKDSIYFIWSYFEPMSKGITGGIHDAYGRLSGKRINK